MSSLKFLSLVLEASAVVRIIEGSSQAAVFLQAVLEAELVLAPELMLTEDSNALWRLQRAGQLQLEGLQQCLNRSAALVDYIEPDLHLRCGGTGSRVSFGSPVDVCLDLDLATQAAAAAERVCIGLSL